MAPAIARDRARTAIVTPLLHRRVRPAGSAACSRGPRAGTSLAPSGKNPGASSREANEGAMRGNVLQTWTPMLLLFSVLAVAAATPGARHRTPTMELPRLFESASPAEYCAVPSPMAGRRLE